MGKCKKTIRGDKECVKRDEMHDRIDVFDRNRSLI